MIFLFYDSLPQVQINELQQTFLREKGNQEKNVSTKEDWEGRLKAQELFWQSKVKNMEKEFNDLRNISDEKLQKIQKEFELEVLKIKKQRRKDKRKFKSLQKKEDGHINIETLIQSVEKAVSHNPKNDSINEPLNDPINDPQPIENNKKDLELNKEAEEIDYATNQEVISDVEKEGENEASENKNIPNILKTSPNNIKAPIVASTIQPAISATSLKSDHVYEAPMSFKTSKESVFELIEKNPSKIDDLRKHCKEELKERLEDLGIEPKCSKLSVNQYNLGMKLIEENRRDDHNKSELKLLREQYEEEVESLVFHSFSKHGSVKKRLSKGMSSFRKQIFRSLQNLRTDNAPKQSQKLSPARPQSSLSQHVSSNFRKKSPKKRAAPQPPKMVQSAATNSCVVENEYVETPEPELLPLPPKPAPRHSKLLPQQVSPDQSSYDSEVESEEDLGEEEMETDDEGNDFEIKASSHIEDVIGDFVDRERDLIKEFVEKECAEKYIEQSYDEVSSISNQSIDNRKGNIIPKDDNEDDLNDDVTVVDEDDASLWDSDEDVEQVEDLDEIVEADVHHEPEEIKLRKPTPGSKIADLTNIIEQQLHRNRNKKGGQSYI